MLGFIKINKQKAQIELEDQNWELSWPAMIVEPNRKKKDSSFLARLGQ